jgi:hypothetical protein
LLSNEAKAQQLVFQPQTIHSDNEIAVSHALAAGLEAQVLTVDLILIKTSFDISSRLVYSSNKTLITRQALGSD